MWYDQPEAKQAMNGWKLQSRFDSDCSLTVMKSATLSTQPIAGLSGIKFSNTSNNAYIRWPERPESIDNCI